MDEVTRYGGVFIRGGGVINGPISGGDQVVKVDGRRVEVVSETEGDGVVWDDDEED